MNTNKKNYIDRLREKPEEHRRKMQFFVSLGITVLILIIWAINFGMDTNEKVAGELREDLSAAVEQAKEGFVILKGEE